MPIFTLRSFLGYPTSAFKVLCAAIALGSLTQLSGCQFLESNASNSVIADHSTLRVKGVAQSSFIARNPAGMPMIEANNFHDLLFTLGFSHAQDRLTQMVHLRLLAQGRLAELHGAQVLDLDRFMRSINLKEDAQRLYKNAPQNLQDYFAIYARGINAYLFEMRDALPPELARANFMPEYWQAQDSALLFALFSFSQSGNLSQEVLALALAQHGDGAQLAELLPIYPDEPLARQEAQTLTTTSAAALSDPALQRSTEQLLDHLNQLSAINSMDAPLASSWVISPQHSASGRSLMAFTALTEPQSPSSAAPAQSTAPASPYTWVSMHSPQLQAAGLSLPGIPFLLSGFNGKLAYSLSAVMADTQDVVSEQLRRQNGRLEYKSDKQWHPAAQRMETFVVKGQRPVREAVYRTAHGPLLTQLSSTSDAGFGLALQRVQRSDDQSLQAMLQLMRSQSVEQATRALPKLNLLAANALLADAQHIAWQVTGTYPNRRNSRGLLPTAGWDSSIAWEGYADSMLYPYDQDPPQGWLSAANQRLTQPGYGMQLSNSWANPERAENLAAQLTRKPVAASLALTGPTQSRPWLITQLQQMLSSAGMSAALQQAMAQLPAAQRAAAQTALRDMLAINPQQPLSATQAHKLNHLLAQSQEHINQLAIKALPSSVQQAFMRTQQRGYAAGLDHILGRDDSSFWQTSGTSKAQFILKHLLSNTTPSASQQTETARPTHTFIVDFSRKTPVSAVSFTSQTDNPHSAYFPLAPQATGRAYPLPIIYRDIKTVYGQQRLTLLPAP